MAKKEKLSELQLRLRQLLDQTEQISKEQNYQRVKTFFSLDYYKWLNLLSQMNFLVPRGALSSNKWSHQLKSPVVVHWSDVDISCNGRMANETFKKVFRSQKACLTRSTITSSWYRFDKLLELTISVIYSLFLSFQLFQIKTVFGVNKQEDIGEWLKMLGRRKTWNLRPTGSNAHALLTN